MKEEWRTATIDAMQLCLYDTKEHAETVIDSLQNASTIKAFEIKLPY